MTSGAESGQRLQEKAVSKRACRRWSRAAQEKITVIGKFLSPTIKGIATVTNDRSDNFYAETLIRMLAKERTGSASYDSCRVVIKRELDSLGVDSGYGIQMVDGSGLARHNYIAPDFFCRFLRLCRCRLPENPISTPWRDRALGQCATA